MDFASVDINKISPPAREDAPVEESLIFGKHKNIKLSATHAQALKDKYYQFDELIELVSEKIFARRGNMEINNYYSYIKTVATTESWQTNEARRTAKERVERGRQMEEEIAEAEPDHKRLGQLL